MLDFWEFILGSFRVISRVSGLVSGVSVPCEVTCLSLPPQTLIIHYHHIHHHFHPHSSLSRGSLPTQTQNPFSSINPSLSLSWLDFSCPHFRISVLLALPCHRRACAALFRVRFVVATVRENRQIASVRECSALAPDCSAPAPRLAARPRRLTARPRQLLRVLFVCRALSRLVCFRDRVGVYFL